MANNNTNSIVLRHIGVLVVVLGFFTRSVHGLNCSNPEADRAGNCPSVIDKCCQGEIIVTDPPLSSGVALIILSTCSTSCCERTCSPTSSPTQSPIPSTPPTLSTPTTSPTTSPTDSPTTSPTWSPTTTPTSLPTRIPSTTPTDSPIASPTSLPTRGPSRVPSKAPTPTPSTAPSSSQPSTLPTKAPSCSADIFGACELAMCCDANETYVQTFVLSQCTTTCCGVTCAPTAAPTSVPSQAPTRVPSSPMLLISRTLGTQAKYTNTTVGSITTVRDGSHITSTDIAGDTIWSTEIDGLDKTLAHGLALDSFGNVLFVGEGIGSNPRNGFVTKYHVDTGDELWTRVLPANVTSFVRLGFVNRNDDVYIAGTVDASIDGVVGANPSVGVVMKFAADDGGVEWVRNFNANSEIASLDTLRCVTVTESGDGVLVVCYGFTSSEITVAVTAKYTGVGDEVFVQTDFV